MTDIEDYYYNGSFKYDAIGKWTGYFCELYVLPSMVYIVSDESHHLRFNSYTLEQCNTRKKLKTIIDHLDDTDDYADIVQLINILENKENEAAEVGAIVNGRVPLAANELFFSIRITVRGSKPAAFVLGILTLAICIVGIKAWMGLHLEKASRY